MPGCLAIVLHAHLPFVRHPEHERFFEETWFFEAVAECYLPLLRVMAGWSRDGLPWRLTLTLTPPLCAMLRDPLLQSRCRRYLAERRALAEQEVGRTFLEPALNRVATFYAERFRELEAAWEAVDGDLVGAFGRHQAAGHLEVITCAATHALLPLWESEPAAVRAQLGVAVADYRRHLGAVPRGLWLPECAWTPGLEPFLREAGLQWFVVETHGLLHAGPRPRCATFAPVVTPGGLAAFGRDPASARQVWSRDGGYPGDPRYREFHRDLAHDADWEYLRPHMAGGEQRVFTGLKYHRVTGGTGEKEPYDRAAALAVVREHAAHFVAGRRRTLGAAAALMPQQRPVVVSPYDAELFGHWWFEGPEFLDAVVRLVCADPVGITLTTPGEYLAGGPQLQVAMPAASSWGEGGHLGVWLDEANAWMQGPMRLATRRLIGRVSELADEPGGPLTDRLLCQAGRELLLAQASDWPFLVKMGTAGEYPAARFREHLDRVHELLNLWETGGERELVAVLAACEARNNLFPTLDWRQWR